MEVCFFFHSNYPDGSLQQSRRQTNPWSPNILLYLTVYPPFHLFVPCFAFHATFCKSVSSLHSSHFSLLSVFHRNEHPHMHTRACTCVKYMKTIILISPRWRETFLSLSILHTLSCNSILIGFIGLAIHLSAATKFNYIRKPFGLSPDNQQHSPPRHSHSHAHASLRIHIKKKIQFLLNNGGTEMKHPTEATSF